MHLPPNGKYFIRWNLPDNFISIRIHDFDDEGFRILVDHKANGDITSFVLSIGFANLFFQQVTIEKPFTGLALCFTLFFASE